MKKWLELKHYSENEQPKLLINLISFLKLQFLKHFFEEKKHLFSKAENSIYSKINEIIKNNPKNINEEYDKIINQYDISSKNNTKLFNFIINNPDCYISGSFIPYNISLFLNFKSLYPNNDIDIYLKNPAKNQYNLLKMGIGETDLKKNKIQLLYYKFTEYKDIIKYYDLSLVK